jgi:hypothetical protein
MVIDWLRQKHETLSKKTTKAKKGWEYGLSGRALA